MFVDMADNRAESVEAGSGRLPRRRPLQGMPGINYRPRHDGGVGPPWEFRYRDLEGRPRWRVVHGTLADADAERARLRAAWRRRQTGLTYEEFASGWLSR